MGIFRKIFGGGSVEQGGTSIGVDYGTKLDPLKTKPEPKPLTRKQLMAKLDEENQKLRKPILITPARGVKNKNEDYPA